MPTAEKNAAVEQLQKTIDEAAAVYLADFTGLDVELMTDLRKECRKNDVQFRVVKNTLAIRASRNLEFEELVPHLKGPTAMASSVADPAAPARVLVDFHKEHKKPELKVGFMDGSILSLEEAHAMANLPTRDELIASVMRCAQGPIQNLLGALTDVMTRVVRVTDAVRDGMEQGTIQSAAPSEEPVAEEAKEAPVEEAAPAETDAAEEPAGEESGGDDAPAEEDKKEEGEDSPEE
ncbi:MAG: 50S ribosomal protein L10 [Gemmatimonadota bacterium]|jgi:large subunit ribosomal protein L10|nr:50S ribosomal protein L10 [Gemmatimonadota bacterium]MDP6462200.1 50S ribosomal protein L10 [Gemmatimonadota bacterium]MDP6530132.1 50S ribosomal protein L10 [Gemmatimonadota bacterium]MDP6803609.1 50S ribosomal protein L10 [Gemmatimonadota bacterium]MDP7032242.1 50S ribosomal protein L10 [Gemmatimonadota bacterium]